MQTYKMTWIKLGCMCLGLCGIPVGALPAQETWESTAVGTPQEMTPTVYNEATGEFLLEVSGQGFKGSSDAGELTATTVTGDTSITARVSELSGPHGWSRAGLTLRESAAADSPHVSIYVTQANGLLVRSRNGQGQGTSNLGSASGITVPVWLKLERQGNFYIATYSEDGITWQEITTHQMSQAQTVQAGVVLSSHQNNQAATARIDQVTVDTLAAPAGSVSPESMAALVERKPTINGTVEGSLQQNRAENVNYNSNARVTESVFMQGTPDVRINGNPSFGGVTSGAGAAGPTNHRVTINSGASIGRLVDRTDPTSLPAAPTVPNPTGYRNVNVNQPGDDIGDFATLRNLNLNSNSGMRVIPPGHYGQFNANSNTGLILGEAGATERAVYSFERLNINSQAAIQVLGPVEIQFKNGSNFNAQTVVFGEESHPEWIHVKVQQGNVHFNSSATFYGRLEVVNGRITINSNALVVGQTFSNQLTINSNGTLRYADTEMGNQGNEPPEGSIGPINADEDAPDTAVNLFESFEDAEDEDAELLFEILSNDNTDLVETVIDPAVGELTLEYQPNQNGQAQLALRVTDTDGLFIDVPFEVNVAAVNDAPVAEDLTVTTDEEISVAVVLNGSDIENDPLNYTLVTVPAHGDLQGSIPNLTYVPNGNFSGNDSFTYIVNDGQRDSATATVTVTVSEVNDSPVAEPQSISTLAGEAVSFILTGNDPEEAALTFTVTQGPSNGTLLGTAPNLTYTPANDFDGTDTIQFTVNDGEFTSDPATITIQVTAVNDAPVAPGQNVSLDEDSATPITLTATDADGDTLTYTIVSDPGNGVLSGTVPNLTYTPDANFNGSDSFSFQANDGAADSNIATISITVNPINDTPAGDPADLTLDEDTSRAILLSGQDIDGDTLTFAVTIQPQNGSLFGTAPNLIYVPDENFNGVDTFSFTVNDGTTSSAPVMVMLAIIAVNDAPVAEALDLETDEDTALNVVLVGTDVEGSLLSYTVLDAPDNGTLSGTAPNLTYAPNAEFNGSDSFTYQVNDGELNSTAATVSINVNAFNDVPDVVDQNLSVDEDTELTVTLSGSDPEGEGLTFSVASAPAQGTLTGSAPDLTYIPNENFNGSDSFTFVANDGASDSAAGTISIAINPVNDAPVAAAATVTTDEDTELAITLLGDDVDGDSLTFTIVDAPAAGSLTGTAPNLTYTPNPDANVPDSFTFKISDGELESEVVTVAINVTPVNDPPVAAGAQVTLTEDTGAGVNLSATDPDGDTLTYRIVQAPSSGVLSGTAPALTYTPAANFNGSDQFTFNVSDGTAESETVTVSLTVTPVNDAPFASPAMVNVAEDGSVVINLIGGDVDGDGVSYQLVSTPSNGTLSGSLPDLTYTPAPNFNGSDSFSFRVNDGSLDSANAIVSITVDPVNDVPVADAVTVSTVEDAPVAVTLTGSDLDEDALSFAVAAGPQNGSLSGTAPNLVYTPATDFSGSDAFTYTANDGAATSSPATVNITVTPGNDRPTAFRKSFETDEAQPVAVVLMGEDPDMDTLTFTVLTPPARGTLSGTAPSLTYTPTDVVSAADGFYTDRFVYSVADPSGEASVAEAEIRVNNVNLPPVITSAAIDSALIPDNRGFLTSTVRDFRASHPDMQRAITALEFNMVESFLDSEKKPILRDGYTNPNDTIESEETFNQWFRDVPGINLTTIIPFYMDPTADGGFEGGALGVEGGGAPDDPGYVPINGRLYDFGLDRTNLHFTTEIHTEFTYTGGGSLIVTSDDDTFVFIDNELVIDIGGVRGAYTQTVDLSQLGLTVGERYSFDLFDTERHATGSVFYVKITGVELDLNPSSYQYQVIAQDPDQDALTYSLLQAPQGMQISQDGLITWTPSLAGDYLVQVQVSDPAALATVQSFTLTVLADSGGRPLFISSPVEVYNGESPTYTYIAIAEDPDGDDFDLRYTITEGPEGAAINPVTGDFSFVVTDQTPDIVPVVLTVTDLDGKIDSQRYNVTILNRQPVVLLEDDLLFYHSGNNPDFSVTASVDDYDNDQLSITWTLVSEHANYSFDPVVGSPVLNAPTPVDPGIYTFQIEVQDGVAAVQDHVEVFIDTPCEVDLLDETLAWWPANGSNDEVINNSRMFFSPDGFTEGVSGMAWRFERNTNQFPIISEEVFDPISNGESFSIEFWAKPDAISGSGSAILTWSEGQVFGSPDSDVLFTTVVIWQLDASSRIDSQNFVLSSTEWNHITLVWDAEAEAARIYINGELNAARLFPGLVPDIGHDLLVGRGNGFSYQGDMDELTIYKEALSADQILSVYTAGSAGKCRPEENRAPFVDAGSDQVLLTTGSLNLNGLIDDDGKPANSIVQQWQILGGPSGGAVLADPTSLTSEVTFSQPGIYRFELVADDAHIRVRDRVSVSVGLPLCQLDLVEAMVNWWPADNNGFDIIGNADADVRTDYTVGKAGEAWAFTEANKSVRSEPEYFSEVVNNGESFTLEFWIKRIGTFPFDVASWRDASNARKSFVLSSSNILWQVNSQQQMATPQVLPSDEWSHAALVWNAAEEVASIYVNGSLQTSRHMPGQLPDVDGSFLLGDADNHANSRGELDEVTLYCAALSPLDIMGIYQADAFGKCRPSDNLPPLVDAGLDREITDLSSPVTLAGRAVDEALPVEQLEVQWSQLAGPVGGATFSDVTSLTSEVTFASPGHYDLQLVVSDGQAATSKVVSFKVGLTLCQTDLTADMIAWWTGNSDVRDIIGGYHGRGTAGYIDAQSGLGWDWTGSEQVILPQAAFDEAATGSFTMEFWINPDLINLNPIFHWRGSDQQRKSRAIVYNNSGIFRWYLDGGQNNRLETSFVINPGAWNHIAMVWDATQSQARLYFNGQPSGNPFTLPGFTPDLAGDLILGEDAEFGKFNGAMDEITLYRRVLTPAELQSIVADGTSGKCLPQVSTRPPLVDAIHPNQIEVADNVELDALVLADGSLSYQWEWVSGPETVSFADPTQALQNVNFGTAGVYWFRLTATDASGQFITQEIKLTVDDRANRQPVVDAGADQQVNIFEGLTLQGSVTDDGIPANQLLSIQWVQVSGPGQAVFDDTTNPQTLVNFTETGTYVLRLTANDSDLTTIDEITLEVLRGPEVVEVTTQSGDTRIDLDTSVTLIARPTDPQFNVASLQFFARGISLGTGLFDAGSGGWQLTVPAGTLGVGNRTVVATATSGSGAIQTGSLILEIFDSVVTDGPFVEINAASLLAQLETRFEIPDAVLDILDFQQVPGVITGPVDVVGTVRDDNLLLYRVEIAPLELVDLENPQLNDPAFRELGRGTTNVENQVVGTIDPSVLANGTYALRIIAEGQDGLANLQTAIVTIESGLKLGRFTYAITDLNVPLVGIPVQVTRIYDSLEANRSGDFGFGWKMALKEGRLEESVPRNDLEDLVGFFAAKSFKVGDRVTVTNPDGRRVGFTFVPDLQDTSEGAGAGLFGTTFKPRFIPDPGVYDRLEVDNVTLGLSGNGEARLYLINLPYNPSEYKLTTKDGRVYRYSDSGSVQGESIGQLIDVQDRNGNLLEFRDDGIFHSSGASIQFVRDGAGRITQIIDPAGNPIVYDYNTEGELQKVTDQAGRFVTFEYLDAPNLHYLDKILDPDGNEIAVQTFDPANGRLDTITDGEGNLTQIFYDEVEMSETRVNTLGDSIVTKFDSEGNSIEIVNEIGAKTTMVYDENDNLLSETNDLGHTTSFTYDERGNVLTETDALNNMITRTYDEDNNTLSRTDSLGRITNFSYDSFGLIVKVIDDNGDSLILKRDSSGRIIEVTDPNGRISILEYDTVSGASLATNNPTKIIRAEGSTLEFQYNAFGQVINAVDESGTIRSFITDNSGLLLERRLRISDVSAPSGTKDLVTTYTYDDNAEISAITNPRGETTTFEHDRNGRLRFRKYTPDANQPLSIASTEFQYDELGRLLKKIDPLNRETQHDYRQDGRLRKIIQPDNTEINFEYDSVGNRTAIVDPSGNRTEFVFDEKNRLKERITIQQSSSPKEIYSYDSEDNVIEILDRLGRIRKYEYSNRNRITKESWFEADGATLVKEISFGYDAMGNVISANDDQALYNYTYDSRDRIKTVQANYLGVSPSSYSLIYNYNDQSRERVVTDGNGISRKTVREERGLLKEAIWQGAAISPVRIEMGYNELGDLESIERYKGALLDELVSSSSIFTVRSLEMDEFDVRSYNANGQEEILDTIDSQLVRESTGSLKIVPEIDELLLPKNNPFKRITRIEHKGSAAQILLETDYGYDLSGLISTALSNSESINYERDGIGQLTQASRTLNPSESYQYDDSGNRLSANGETYSVSEFNRYETVGDFEIEHDLDGNIVTKENLITGERWLYNYDHRNRLIGSQHFVNSQALNPDLKIQYHYDLFDRRIRKIVNGVEARYQYEEERIWKEETDLRDTHFLYGEQIDQILARYRSDSGLAFHLLDRQQSVEAIIDDSGAILNANEYSSFGEVLNQSNSAEAGLFAYTGREYDSETGLYFYRSRNYDPALGRFLTEDTVKFSGGDYNLYRYVENSPQTYVDPYGTTASFELRFLRRATVLNPTVSSLRIGLQKHRTFLRVMRALNGRGRLRLGDGVADYIDWNKRIIYELKPANVRQGVQGLKQLERYYTNLQGIPGVPKDGWKLVLVLY